MKKYISCILALVMVTALASITAYAANAPENRMEATQMEEVVVMPRATSAPTQAAPNSWYHTQHQWTAKYYTYTSYYFNWGSQQSFSFRATADKSFTLEAYSYDTDELIGEIEAEIEGSGNTYAAEWTSNPVSDNQEYNHGVYFVLRNTDSGSITNSDNGHYYVGKY